MSAADPTPLIGLTTYRQRASWGAWDRDAALCPGVYLDVVQRAGGQPVLIPPSSASAAAAAGAGARADRGVPTGGAEHLVRALDALVLVGGGDVVAARYGQVADPHHGGSDPQRDDLEFALVDEALRRDLPILAVCRGMQVLNVALGGDLVQHLPDVLGSTDHQPAPGTFGAVEVLTEDDSQVRRILGPAVEVLCSHHQAVGTLGRDLVVTARSADGVIEAVELPDRRFVVGVQWHPEESGDPRLFEALIAAATAATPTAAAPTAGAPSPPAAPRPAPGSVVAGRPR
jgi:gamma-glutamyl-gamma-aminobutyrate hydrolase PuuD